MNPIDISIIVIYLLLIFYIGIYTRKYISDFSGKFPDISFEKTNLLLINTSKEPVLGDTEFPIIFILFLKFKIIFDTRSNSGL